MADGGEARADGGEALVHHVVYGEMGLDMVGLAISPSLGDARSAAEGAGFPGTAEDTLESVHVDQVLKRGSAVAGAFSLCIQLLSRTAYNLDLTISAGLLSSFHKLVHASIRIFRFRWTKGVSFEGVMTVRLIPFEQVQAHPDCLVEDAMALGGRAQDWEETTKHVAEAISRCGRGKIFANVQITEAGGLPRAAIRELDIQTGSVAFLVALRQLAGVTVSLTHSRAADWEQDRSLCAAGLIDRFRFHLIPSRNFEDMNYGVFKTAARIALPDQLFQQLPKFPNGPGEDETEVLIAFGDDVASEFYGMLFVSKDKVYCIAPAGGDEGAEVDVDGAEADVNDA